ncbi:Alpha/beta hydrolase fold-1 [Xylaria arbuscula]|nr:Alpha/beta hydrolase fold-1 [Xylaria arbuscula]
MSSVSGPKPTIVLSCGSFVLPESYDAFVNHVVAQGLEIHLVHHPSVGLSPDKGREVDSLPTAYDDAAGVADVVRRLANSGKDVILVTHSYGGIPATQSLKGLAKAAREIEGKAGGVVRLAYITSIVPSIGQTANDWLVDAHLGERLDFRVDDKGWMYQPFDKTIVAILYSDVPAEVGEAGFANFTRQSSASFATPLTYAGYCDVPVSYLVCEDDLIIPRHLQEAGIAMIEQHSGHKVHVTSVKAGHFPTTSLPQELASWVVELTRMV